MVFRPEQHIKEKAYSLGFDACGITSCQLFEKESNALDEWIKNNYHAQMEFITKYREQRKNPALLHEGTKSVIVVLLNYQNPDYSLQKKSRYSFVQYALGKDYHVVVKEKLHQLSDYLQTLFPETTSRCFVDSAPLFEKAFAVQAGLGWIGKNTLLTTPKGSHFFIGEIFTTLALQSDKPFSKQDCGSCNQCVKACPTHALNTPYVLNAKHCLTYQSIENKDIEWNESLKPFASDYIYGCDICLQVCPYNQAPNTSLIPEFHVKDEILHFTDNQWEQLSEDDFNRIFADSAVKRIGYKKFMENVKIAKQGK